MRRSSAPLISRAVLWLIEDPLIVSKVLQSATYMWRYCPLISLLLRKSDYHNNCQMQAPLGKNYKPEASALAEEMVSFSVLLAFAGLTVVSCQVQFPCDHFLRIFLSWSSLFQHCQCQYENSVDVIPLAGPPISVPRSECKSGVKIPGILYQNGVLCNATGCDECPDRNVSEWFCWSSRFSKDCLVIIYN